MKRTNLIIYVFCMIGVIVWLIASNHLILTLSGTEQLQMINSDIKTDGNAEVLGGLSTFDIVPNDLLERIYVSGWAFSKTTEDNSHRKTFLVFKNKSACYKYEFKIPEGIDSITYNSVIYRGPAIAAALNIPIPNPEIGFVGEFSTLGMKDGIYELYIICHENESTYGAKSLDTWIQKRGHDVETIDATSLRIIPAESERHITEATPGVTTIDLIQVKGDAIFITGWAFVEEMDCQNQTVYVEVAETGGEYCHYACFKQHMRQDVGEAFDNEFYNRSGFDAYIPIPKTEEWTVRILIENDERIWGGIQYTVSKDQDGYVFVRNS